MVSPNSSWLERVSGPWVLLVLFILAGCAGNSAYIAQKKATEERSAALPYVKNGYVELDTVVAAQMSDYGGRGSFSPPRPTEAFPYIWGDSPQAQQQAMMQQQGYQQPLYQQPVYQQPAYQQQQATPAKPTNRPKLAVMEIEDQAGKLGKDVAARGTDYLRATLNATKAFIVIDKSRQAEALMTVIVDSKKESYKDCYNQSCQIPLGQALAADTILRTSITRLASFCTLSSELVDLEKEAATGGGMAKFDCTEDGLSMAIEKLVPQLIQ